jgi:hypothetical protein
MVRHLSGNWNWIIEPRAALRDKFWTGEPFLH